MRLDDPSFPAPIFANLIADPKTGLHTLIWSRPKVPAQAGKRQPDRQGNAASRRRSA